MSEGRILALRGQPFLDFFKDPAGICLPGFSLACGRGSLSFFSRRGGRGRLISCCTGSGPGRWFPWHCLAFKLRLFAGSFILFRCLCRLCLHRNCLGRWRLYSALNRLSSNLSLPYWSLLLLLPA